MSPSKMPPQFKKMTARKAGKPEKGESKKHEKAEAKMPFKVKGAKCKMEKED